MYLYSLEPPPNPNKLDALAKCGKKIFESEGCGTCHTPPLYTSNKLTPAEGFRVHLEARTQIDIALFSVGTDRNMTLKTRRGTGYYKLPSLKGVWYRSMFDHSGWCASVEDWFDPNAWKTTMSRQVSSLMAPKAIRSKVISLDWICPKRIVETSSHP
jgi:hypothetical protein